MAEPYERAVASLDPAAAACTLCGEPTVGTIAEATEESDWPREYPCCPACSYGVDEGDLHRLLRVTARGPN
jgi:hypothetical protein